MGISVLIYCYGMSTDSPLEYLSLPAGEDENFSEIYDRRYAENPHYWENKCNRRCTSWYVLFRICYCYVWVFVAVYSKILVFCDVMLHCWVDAPQCFERRYFLDLQGSSGPWGRNLYTSHLLHLTCNHFHWATDWSDLACISLPHIGILHEPLDPWRWTHWCSITSRRLESCSVTCRFYWPFSFLIC